MKKLLRIGTRESQLARWQAERVQSLLAEKHIDSELILIKSDGDLDTVTPLYELGVQGIFTKSLDAALLENRIDLAVHSMKDVPTQQAKGIQQAAVLERGTYKDILVFKGDRENIETSLENNSSQKEKNSFLIIATSSTRRKAQWLHRYPLHVIESLRGNVNSRLKKIEEKNWNGAIFAAAGLERIGLRPDNSIDLDWMLPAPAQGAITISCRTGDEESFSICHSLNNANTELCTKIERDFLRALLGGCSTPISALAVIENNKISFKGNICSPDGKQKIDIEKNSDLSVDQLGMLAAGELLKSKAVQKILSTIRNGQ